MKVKPKINIIADSICLPCILATLNLRLRFSTIRKIIKQKTLANVSLENAEIGCHIDIDISAKSYETEANTMMQFSDI